MYNCKQYYRRKIFSCKKPERHEIYNQGCVQYSGTSYCFVGQLIALDLYWVLEHYTVSLVVILSWLLQDY